MPSPSAATCSAHTQHLLCNIAVALLAACAFSCAMLFWGALCMLDHQRRLLRSPAADASHDDGGVQRLIGLLAM